MSKRYRRTLALDNVSLAVGRPQRAVRAARTQRRRQDDLAAHPVHDPQAGQRDRTGSAGSMSVGQPLRARRNSGWCPGALARRSPHVYREPQFQASPMACRRRCASRPDRRVLDLVELARLARQARAHALRRDEAAARDRPGAGSTIRACCFSMSRRSGSTRSRADGSGISSGGCAQARSHRRRHHPLHRGDRELRPGLDHRPWAGC